MDRMFARSATIALCVLWAGAANAGSPSAMPDADALTGPAATQIQPSDRPGANDPDLAAVIKNLPANLDGEIRRAQLLRAKGAYQDAARSLSQLMIVAPDDPRVVGEFGKVMAQEGRSQDALAFLKRGIELQPSDWTLYSALGVAYDQLDDHAHARAAYQHALTLKPGDPTVLNNYAVSRMLAGDLDGAQRLMAQASTGSSDFPKIANNVAMLASMRTSGVQPAPSVAENTQAATSVGMPRALVHVASLPSPAPAAPPAPATASGPRVVMQKVPLDPLAGPVMSYTPKPTHKVAATHPKKPKPVLASKDTTPAPALRTAAQVN
ncbi:MAG: tetratricopeptide repeat protein [Rhizomicrobium sp.]|jgi:Flp pilus assembly protein TadD